ncbi:MAG: M20/M25/M40 family metallo-hydrolase [Clostridia bacterium]|nr:M20/M25/M40 family metallo-hydrolase [Clostridia bacterium]
MIKKFANDHKEMTVQIVRDLCKIPAPSFGERKRAEFCKAWLENVGAKDVYIDEINNVIFPIGCDGSNEITVVAAHTDTVFPDTTPYPEYREDDENIYCPSAEDDSSGVAVLLMTAKYFIDNAIVPEKGVMFVCNVCEEGLGNLAGTRQLMKDYSGRIKRFITLDECIGYIVTDAVGSHRYEVEVKTEGGHSFSKFGNQNAIHALSKIVNRIYEIVPLQKEGSKSTYNVGTIEGGTSVNTIAQSAKMLCEYRSNDRECLESLRQEFERIFEEAKSDKVEVIVNKIGDRPCKGIVDPSLEKEMIDAYAAAVKEFTSKETYSDLASTDANVPMSLNIPAACMGVFIGEGAHTREEFTNKAALTDGVKISIRTITELLK